MKLLNLHLNTTFSFLESTISVDEAIKKAKEEQVEYLVFSEKNHFFSLAEANLKCIKNGIKPIFGLDVFLTVDNEEYQFNLFAKNSAAFDNLKLLSYYLLDDKKISLNEIFENYKDIIVIENPNLSYYKKQKKEILNPNYYIGIDINEIKEYENLLQKNKQVLIFNNFNTLDFQDFSILELLNKISNKNNFLKLQTPLFFNYEKEDDLTMQLILQTNEFIKNLYFPFLKKEYQLLSYENNENLNSKDYLKFLLVKKIKSSNELENLFNQIEYKNRLKKELEIINLLNFEDYFLIIQDWVNWAKNHDISIGPGRGSSAGSLISFVLGITEIDPIKYGLIFERFLNPKRISMPDIDIDVQDDKRMEIINYLINKYGYERVNNIVTFSTLGKKSAIRDILRAYNISPIKINQISKLIPSNEDTLIEEVNKNLTLNKELEQLNPHDSTFKNKIINQTTRISGFYRQIGTHAAGIVIAKNPTIELIPISKKPDNFLQTQISMEYLEYFGLIKMDILGLKTLTTIKEIEAHIKKNTQQIIDWNVIGYFDKKTFALLSSGNTAGVFQVESPIMIKALKEIKVDTFNDIAAVISLNRPGPMAYVSNYAKRKAKKEEIPKISKEYDDILNETYGIIIYQEQIMQIAQKIANMSFEEADLLRKIISKKQANEMLAIKKDFIERASKNNYDKKVVEEIFNNIERFADYGFNKSHAIAYSMLTFKMAYLKANYPLEFFASCISSANGAQTTIAKYFNEARKMGIEIITPNINKSYEHATIEKNQIILPLGLIKGIGPEIVKLIVENRNNVGEYKNFLHCFFNLSKIKSFGKAALETLIKANALRDFNLSQATMLKEIDQKSDSSIFIKQNLPKNPQEILDKLLDFEPENDEIDNEDELRKNEIELLGQNYSFIPTLKYEKQNQRLIDTRIGNEYILIAECTDVLEKISKYKKPYQQLYFQDSSLRVVSYMYKIDPELKNLKNKLVQIKFIKKTENEIILKEWKVIK
ncbi:DNA polymerase III subunit alpha [Metamycoplasma alkalescens]|uniref:DNA polymerase III subunit alpha n=1 Tax=Metamycoplasma alkalescens TaxID=45363 RepID=UPI003CFC699F